MRYLILAVTIAVGSSAAWAQSLEATDHGYVYRQGGQSIRFQRGKWTAGIDGGGELSWHMFLWHDRWVYETLPGGAIESEPVLAEGSLVMRGAFSAREGSPPVKYVYRITPAAEGLRVRCELQKTGTLKLTNGVWLHLSGAKQKFRGSERVWLSPSTHGTLLATPAATANRVLVELRDHRSLCLGLPGYRQVEKEGGRGDPMFRVKLLNEDFAADKKAVVEYTIGFADMPQQFPGAIEPARGTLAIGAVASSAERVPQYERLELRVSLGATFDNPFDPDDVRLDAVFTTPSGKRLVVPGFFAVEHRREVAERAEVMIPQGNGGWRVRYAPREPGRHRWQLQLRDRSGQVAGGEGEGEVECVAGKRPGFVGISKADPHYLAFDSGQGYFAIGHNLPIYHTTGQLGTEAMGKFAAAGENFNRWWMSSSGFGIEWADRLGWYRQDVAARIDAVLDLAAERGLCYMMCMDTHQDFREAGWQRNPFNAKNGGPCAAPRDWFTNEAARRYYKKRLRYTVARWGYSPSVLCWEFGNEMEGWDGSPDEVKLPWHKEMADYLRSIDPFGHLITTSFWSNTGPEAYWDLENIDIVQTHCYTNDDANVAEAVRRYCLHQWRRFPKPHIFGEFGIRSHATTADKDPKGWAIHNSLWAGLSSFSAGGPMPWWHEDYLDPLNLYFHFTALARFVGDLPLGSARWEPLQTAAPEFVDRSRPPQTRDVTLATLNRWGKAEHSEFTVLGDGTIEGDRRPQQLLHGRGHQDLRNPPTFVATFPKPGQFIVRVGKVSAGGVLQVSVDGEVKLHRELPCGQGLGKQSVYQPRWTLWETTYDEDFAVDVPAGRHRIRVENLGKDWVTVTGYTLTGCHVLDKPNVLVCGMKTGNQAIVWLQNKDSGWYNHGRGSVRPVDAFRLAVQGLPDGRYDVEWWETWQGNRRRSEPTESRGGRLVLTVPTLPADEAVKIRPAR